MNGIQEVSGSIPLIYTRKVLICHPQLRGWQPADPILRCTSGTEPAVQAGVFESMKHRTQTPMRRVFICPETNHGVDK